MRIKKKLIEEITISYPFKNHGDVVEKLKSGVLYPNSRIIFHGPVVGKKGWLQFVLSQYLEKTILKGENLKSSIFFVTGVSANLEKRTFGYFFSEKSALKAVTSNLGDLFEDRFRYAVVEKIKPGIYGKVIKESWFCHVSGRVFAMEKPFWIETTNFALG